MHSFSGFIGLIALLLAAEGATAQMSELELGYTYRSQVLSRYSTVPPENLSPALTEAWTRLLRTPIMGHSPALPYQLNVLVTDSVNASSFAGGQIYLHTGLAEAMGNDSRLVAATLGHELGHCVRQHHYRHYLARFRAQVAYQNCIINAKSDAARTGCNLGKLIGGLVGLKLDRKDEHEADMIGMLLMAQAGYHPAYAISAFSRLEQRLGNPSKLAAFFQDHPRAETRVARLSKGYLAAVAEFERLWPDSERSPGGPPPVLALLAGDVKWRKVKEGPGVVFTVPLEVHHAPNRGVGVVLVFTRNGAPVAAAEREFANTRGNLVAYTRITPGNSSEKTVVNLTLPSRAIALQDRKTKATAIVLDDEGTVLDVGMEFGVEFPKSSAVANPP